ncbi:prefoldin alpha subunit [Methanococcus voltae]|uniref:prefoldin subunit alpha n=1 Tax=Methanococcus voltae TaxID=2188 RepID=UPI001AE5D67D|nr:prefoldin subunit alpha [Methanococcus voltae]MBP2143748.1 prefoldin alpha subunit [Methanococcus voltae]
MQNQETQNQFMALDVYGEQVKKLQEESSGIEVMISELEKGIDSMYATNTEGEIIIPLGGGAFVKAEVKTPGKVIVAVASDIFMEKDVESAADDFKHSIEELQKTKDVINQHIAKLNQEITNIRADLEKRAQQIEKRQKLIQRGRKAPNQ